MIGLDFRFVLWPEAPVDAARYFYSELVPKVREALGSEGPWADIPKIGNAMTAVAVIFPNAAGSHRAWRLAAIQELAREAAPKRVNGVVGDCNEATDDAVEWLEKSPGITGQLLDVDGKSTQSG